MEHEPIRRRTGNQLRKHRAIVLSRDGGICAICHRDTHDLKFRVMLLLDIGMSQDEISRRLNMTTKQLMACVSHEPFWQMDHIVPLVEGGTNQIKNIRTLCVWCHREETKALHRRDKDAYQETT